MHDLKTQMTQERYSLALTTSSLRTPETVKLARLYAKYRKWNIVRDHVIEHNTLQQRTTTSSKKLCQELISRLRLLSDDELDYLTNCPESEAALVVWVAVCRRYAFIRDFVLEIGAERQLVLSRELQHADFDTFFNSKIAHHRELETVSLSTRLKARQVMFTMLREVGFLDRQNQTNILTPGDKTLVVLQSHGRECIEALSNVVSTSDNATKWGS